MAATKFQARVLAVSILLYMLAGTDGLERGQPDIFEEVLNQTNTADLTMSTSLGLFGTLTVRAFNVELIDIEAAQPPSLTADNETITMTTSDMSIEANADWTVGYRSYFYDTDYSGTMWYRLHPVSLNVVYGIDAATDDVQFRQEKCDGDITIEELTFDPDNGSWMYEKFISLFEDELTEKITGEMCKFLDPVEQELLARRLAEYLAEDGV